jgi:hypothetical protein
VSTTLFPWNRKLTDDDEVLGLLTDSRGLPEQPEFRRVRGKLKIVFVYDMYWFSIAETMFYVVFEVSLLLFVRATWLSTDGYDGGVAACFDALQATQAH